MSDKPVPKPNQPVKPDGTKGYTPSSPPPKLPVSTPPSNPKPATPKK